MADNNTILEKLEGLVARFEEVSTLITDPAVIADQKRYVKLTKEYKELGDLMEARKEYIQVLNGIEEAKEIISNETDPEMREMAREELDACQARQPELEEHIKLLLVPADPQDSKNAILEIRRERRVELACEGFRKDDILRWKVGKLLEMPQGVYIAELNTVFDVTGDGVTDVGVFLNKESVKPIYKKKVLYYLEEQGEKTSISLSEGDHGYICLLYTSPSPRDS